jgi:hypothetical protein
VWFTILVLPVLLDEEYWSFDIGFNSWLIKRQERADPDTEPEVERG